MASGNASRIAQLAAMIQSQTSKVDEYFTAHKLPSPSFDEDLPTDLPQEIELARNGVLIAADELTDLMAGPQALAEGMPMFHTSHIGIQAVARYGIAAKLAFDEQVSFEELADRCQLPASDFTRILRQAMSRHVFKESRPGYVAHTAASRLYAQSEALNGFAHTAFDYSWPAAAFMLDAVDKWKASEEPTQTGFNFAYRTSESWFDSMKDDPRREKAFANSMKYMHVKQGLGVCTSQLLESHDWASVKTMVDVGGALGDVSADIARAHPHIKCIVQDLPGVISQAESKVPKDIAARLEFMPHDFLTPQPVVDADVYLLRWVLHDWADSRAMVILRSLVPTLKKGAYIILQEFVVPPAGMLPFYHEKMIRCIDLAMKATFNSRERGIEDWKKLLAGSDARFHFQGIDMRPGSNAAVIKVRWDEA